MKTYRNAFEGEHKGKINDAFVAGFVELQNLDVFTRWEDSQEEAETTLAAMIATHGGHFSKVFEEPRSALGRFRCVVHTERKVTL